MLNKASHSQHHINSVTQDINLVDREEMSGLSSMYLEGEDRNLGIVKNFKDNREMAKFMPNDLSISWTHLNPDETLDTHRHPIASLVIAVEGDGSSKGDTEIQFKGGDAIIIPAWNEHGFTGSNPNGFWALSIQFHHIAIFENETDPLTVFNDDDKELPPLSERQLERVSAEETSSPATFRSNKTLNNILPKNTDFCWHKITSTTHITAPRNDSKRLVMVCSGQGMLSTATDIDIQSGNAFWQSNDILLINEKDKPLWILTLEVKTEGQKNEY